MRMAKSLVLEFKEATLRVHTTEAWLPSVGLVRWKAPSIGVVEKCRNMFQWKFSSILLMCWESNLYIVHAQIKELQQSKYRRIYNCFARILLHYLFTLVWKSVALFLVRISAWFWAKHLGDYLLSDLPWYTLQNWAAISKSNFVS